MGLNIVIGCKRHRERYWIYRGHEEYGIGSFYREHWKCAHDHPDNVVLTSVELSTRLLVRPFNLVTRSGAHEVRVRRHVPAARFP